MNIEEGLVAYFNSVPAVASAITGGIHPGLLPQDATFPAVVYNVVSNPREIAHTGPSGLASPRFQFDVYANTYPEAREAAHKVRLAFNGFQGSMGTVEVDAVFVENEQDGYDDARRKFWRQMDVIIWHGED